LIGKQIVDRRVGMVGDALESIGDVLERIDLVLYARRDDREQPGDVLTGLS
jgi:hypothetical protein